MAQGRGSATLGLALDGLLAVCLLLGAADIAKAATNNVEWSFNVDGWFRGQSFHAETSTVMFNYDPSVHNVMAVDAGGYYGYRPSGTVYSSGNDHIMLGPGTNYFICSLNGHCGMGMKMAVTAS
ncbi:basic blue protein-like [Phragmites australis]|uniref:basic blue protein-like n=1 Tax=Phragmites australis TaxID=29695 RepID=UPI002D776768|nr:basic blue protein-like [Phragmites australis]